MAKTILTDAYISINSVVLSGWAKTIEMELEKEKIEVSGFSSTGATEYLPGKKEEAFTVEFNQDFAAAAVDATLWPLYNAGTTVPFVIKPTSGAVSATNPQFTGNCNVYTYAPLNGELGEVSSTEVEFQITGGISRATS